MSKKLPVNGFKSLDNDVINEEFRKNYDEKITKRKEYPRRLHELHSDLPLLSERM